MEYRPEGTPEPKAPADREGAPNPAGPLGASEVPHVAESQPAESADAKKERWKTIFRTVFVSGQAEEWAESKRGLGKEIFVGQIDDLVTLLTADPEVLPLLKGYQLYISEREANQVMRGLAKVLPNIRVSARGLVTEGPATTADFFVAEIRKQAGLTPKINSEEAASEPSLEAPVVPPQREAPQNAENTPSEKEADLILKWETVFGQLKLSADARSWAESEDGPGMEKLLQNLDELFVRISSDVELLIRLFKYSVIVVAHGSSVSQDNCNISGPDLMMNGVLRTAEFLSAEIRAMEGLAPTPLARSTQPPERDDVRRLTRSMEPSPEALSETEAPASAEVEDKAHPTEHAEGKKETLLETVDRLNAYNSQFVLSIANWAEREDNVNILRRIEDEIYPIIIPLIRPASHIKLELGYQNIYSYDEGRGERTSAEGSDGIEIDKRDTNEKIIAHVLEFLKHHQEFAVDGTESEEKREEGKTDDEEREEEVDEDENNEEQEPMSLVEARDDYARAYAEYIRRTSSQRNQALGIGGDTAALETARERYDAALKIAAEAIREEESKNSGTDGGTRLTKEAKIRIRRKIFEELVVNEERKLADLEVVEGPQKEQDRFKNIWAAYTRLPRWKKVAISVTLGAAVAAATETVAGIGVLLYAGQNLASPLISAGASVATTMGLEAYDRTAGRAETKEYQMDRLLQRGKMDISQNLDDLRRQYKALLDHQANREKKRMFLKVSIATLAGIGTALGIDVS